MTRATDAALAAPAKTSNHSDTATNASTRPRRSCTRMTIRSTRIRKQRRGGGRPRTARWFRPRFGPSAAPRSLGALAIARSEDFIACTVASRRFLGQARVLADSFFEHHPDGRFAVLIPDDPDGQRSMDERIEVLRPLDIGVEAAELDRMALAYTVKELSCAMKVRLVRHLI